jgi:hypothetical protein
VPCAPFGYSARYFECETLAPAQTFHRELALFEPAKVRLRSHFLRNSPCIEEFAEPDAESRTTDAREVRSAEEVHSQEKKMKLKVLVATAAAPILATVAYAQTPPAPTTPSTTPSAAAPAPATTSTTDAASAPQWYAHQQGEWRTSKLVGSKVKNNAGDTIGDINEIILANDGSAAAAVIGVGGFLGMGEHQVAVQFKSLKIDRDSNGNDVVKLDTTKDALKAAPEWTWQSS